MPLKLEAVIFDLDGVISDTQKIKTNTSLELLKQKYDVKISFEEYERLYAGMKTKHIFEEIFKNYKIKDDLDAFIEYRIQQINSQVANIVPIIPGSIELIKHCKNLGLKIGLASGGMHYWVDLILDKLNIVNQFDAIAYSDEVQKAKPDPEIYSLAATKLKVNPEQCLVIEDAVNGMIAAKKANMYCLGLIPKDSDKSKYCADILVNSLENLNIDKIWEEITKS